MPMTMVRVDGVAATEKSITTRVTVVLWAMLPLVPVIVSVYEPLGVLPEVAIFRTESPEPATEAGVNPALAPAGSPVTLQVIVSLKLFNAVALAV